MLCFLCTFFYLTGNTTQHHDDTGTVQNWSGFSFFVQLFLPMAGLALIWRRKDIFTKLWVHLDKNCVSVFCPSFSQRDQMLKWAQRRLPSTWSSSHSRTLSSGLSELWFDGSLLCTLINTAVPGACPNPHRHWKKPPTHAQALAYKYLGVVPIFAENDLEDNIFTTTRERYLVYYLNQIHQAIGNIESGIIVKYPTHDFIARGMGLFDGEQHREATFYIYQNTEALKQKRTVIIHIRGPYSTIGETVVRFQKNVIPKINTPDNENETNDSKKHRHNIPLEQLFCKFKDRINGKKKHSGDKIVITVVDEPTRAKITYLPNHFGMYEINLISNGELLIGCPFNVNVAEAGLPDKEHPLKSMVTARKVISKTINFIDHQQAVSNMEADLKRKARKLPDNLSSCSFREAVDEVTRIALIVNNNEKLQIAACESEADSNSSKIKRDMAKNAFRNKSEKIVEEPEEENESKLKSENAMKEINGSLEEQFSTSTPFAEETDDNKLELKEDKAKHDFTENYAVKSKIGNILSNKLDDPNETKTVIDLHNNAKSGYLNRFGVSDKCSKASDVGENKKLNLNKKTHVTPEEVFISKITEFENLAIKTIAVQNQSDGQFSQDKTMQQLETDSHAINEEESNDKSSNKNILSYNNDNADEKMKYNTNSLIKPLIKHLIVSTNIDRKGYQDIENKQTQMIDTDNCDGKDIKVNNKRDNLNTTSQNMAESDINEIKINALHIKPRQTQNKKLVVTNHNKESTSDENKLFYQYLEHQETQKTKSGNFKVQAEKVTNKNNNLYINSHKFGNGNEKPINKIKADIQEKEISLTNNIKDNTDTKAMFLKNKCLYQDMENQATQSPETSSFKLIGKEIAKQNNNIKITSNKYDFAKEEGKNQMPCRIIETHIQEPKFTSTTNKKHITDIVASSSYNKSYYEGIENTQNLTDDYIRKDGQVNKNNNLNVAKFGCVRGAIKDTTDSFVRQAPIAKEYLILTTKKNRHQESNKHFYQEIGNTKPDIDKSTIDEIDIKKMYLGNHKKDKYSVSTKSFMQTEMALSQNTENKDEEGTSKNVSSKNAYQTLPLTSGRLIFNPKKTSHQKKKCKDIETHNTLTPANETYLTPMHLTGNSQDVEEKTRYKYNNLYQTNNNDKAKNMLNNEMNNKNLKTLLPKSTIFINKDIKGNLTKNLNKPVLLNSNDLEILSKEVKTPYLSIHPNNNIVNESTAIPSRFFKLEETTIEKSSSSPTDSPCSSLNSASPICPHHIVPEDDTDFGQLSVSERRKVFSQQNTAPTLPQPKDSSKIYDLQGSEKRCNNLRIFHEMKNLQTIDSYQSTMSLPDMPLDDENMYIGYVRNKKDYWEKLLSTRSSSVISNPSSFSDISPSKFKRKLIHDHMTHTWKNCSNEKDIKSRVYKSETDISSVSDSSLVLRSYQSLDTSLNECANLSIEDRKRLLLKQNYERESLKRSPKIIKKLSFKDRTAERFKLKFDSSFQNQRGLPSVQERVAAFNADSKNADPENTDEVLSGKPKNLDEIKQGTHYIHNNLTEAPVQKTLKRRFSRALKFFKKLEDRSPSKISEVKPVTQTKVKSYESVNIPIIKARLMRKRNSDYKLVSDKFCVDNVFEDVIGSRRGSFKGTPNRSALVCALATFSRRNSVPIPSDDNIEIEYNFFKNFKRKNERKSVKSIFDVNY